jgi:hypothetical protein
LWTFLLFEFGKKFLRAITLTRKCDCWALAMPSECGGCCLEIVWGLMRSLDDSDGCEGFVDAVKGKAGDGLRSATKFF